MAIKKFKPTTPSRRYMTVSSFEKLPKLHPKEPFSSSQEIWWS